MTKPWMLITGATDGLGLALARLCVTQFNLVLVGRRPRSLLTDPVFNQSMYCEADFVDPQNACAQIAHCLHEHDVPCLRYVIHNAATGYYGPIPDQTAADIINVLNVNLRAPIMITQRLLPWLVGGKVVVISSVASQLPAPEYAVYAASKAALESWARAVKAEWNPGLAVQILRLGAIRTQLHAKLGIPQSRMDWTRFPPVEAAAKHTLAAVIHSDYDRVIGVGNNVLWVVGYWVGHIIERVGRWRKSFV